jgi:hypothetical protein
VREKLCHLCFSHVGGVALPVKQYKTAYPVDVGVLGSDAVMFSANHIANAIEQFRIVGLASRSYAFHNGH